MPFINVIPNNSEESESIHQMLADSSLYSNPTVTPLEVITIHLFYRLESRIIRYGRRAVRLHAQPC